MRLCKSSTIETEMKKIKECESISELEKVFLHDRESGKPRFPIRFILCNSDCDRDLAGMFKKNDIQICSLNSNNGPNIWTTKDILKEIECQVKAQHPDKEHGVAIFRLTQCLRLLNENEVSLILNDLSDREYNDLQCYRVYIPLIDFTENTQKFWSDYHRNGEREAPWILSAGNESSNNIKCLLLSESLHEEAAYMRLPIIETFSDWLMLYEMKKKDEDGDTRMCVCINRNIVKEGIQIPGRLNILEILNYKTLIENLDTTLYRGICNWQYFSEHERYWKRLRQDAARSNLFAYITDKCNVKTLDAQTLCEAFLRTKDIYVQWVIIMYIIHSENMKSEYITLVCKKLQKTQSAKLLDKDVFSELLYTTIFDSDCDLRSHAESRKQIIIKCQNFLNYDSTTHTQNTLKKHLEEFTCQASGNVCLSRVIIGLFDFELEVVLKAYHDEKIKLKSLLEVCPKIRWYYGSQQSNLLKDAKSDLDNIISEYLIEYRRNKLEGKEASDKLKQLLMKCNGTDNVFWRWYHGEIDGTMALIEKNLKEKKKSKILWVDGMGAEWIPFLENRFSTYQDIRVEISYATSLLPTITKIFNKQIEESGCSIDQKYAELDSECFHGTPSYEYPRSFIKELRVMGKIVEDIYRRCKCSERVLIVSDHGATVFSRFEKAANLSVSGNHEGRCVANFDGKERKDDRWGIICEAIDGIRYYIAKTHSSLTNKSLREAHGGCTPEEVLVPFIIVERVPNVLTDDSVPRGGTSCSSNMESEISVIEENDLGFDD